MSLHMKKYNMSKMVELVLVVVQNRFNIINYK